MNNGDWFVKAFANKDIPEKLKVMWEPILWGAVNIDMIPKIMGQAPCSKEEREEIKKVLFDEHRYELLVAMTYAENYDKCQAKDKRRLMEDCKSSHSDNRVYQNLAQGQLLSFLRWCDEKDYRDIFEEHTAIDLYRISFITLAIGYKQLTLFLVGLMDEQELKAGADAMERFGSKRKLLLKRWVSEFSRKQPESKNKNKLALRIVRYGTQLLTPANDR